MDIQKILKDHELWLRGDPNGRRADLRGADLRGANLYEANLYEADLREAYLRGANLRGADLRRANLRGADLLEVDLREANLRGADLRGANLYEANLYEADLREADLREANLRGAKNIDRAYWNSTTAFYPLQCPEKGLFIGYKKASGYIVELRITEDAKRSSATSRKCRCSKAEVISITNKDGSESGLTEIKSSYDGSFVYRIGEIVSVDNFDDDRWNECSTGIHFFITREEAVKY